MSDKLTLEQIAEIKGRLEAATPGPWGREGDPVTCNEVSDVRGIKLYGKYKAVRCRDDAAFIAAAPADIAALLAHAAALDAENARLRKVAEAAYTATNSGASILAGYGLVDMGTLLALADAVNAWKEAE